MNVFEATLTVLGQPVGLRIGDLLWRSRTTAAHEELSVFLASHEARRGAGGGGS